MQEASGDVQEQEAPTVKPSPPHQSASATAITVPAPPSSATTAGTDSVTVVDPDDDCDATGPREETPELEAGAWQGAEETDRKREERAMQPETPERMAPPPGTASHARADETAAHDVDAFKPDDGCTTPPPPPVHGSDDDRVAASTGGKRAGVAAARSRLLAFRSFARGKKGNKSGNAAPPEGRAPSPGEHLPAHGKAWEEAGADDKDKGQAKWKRFWK